MSPGESSTGDPVVWDLERLLRGLDRSDYVPRNSVLDLVSCDRLGDDLVKISQRVLNGPEGLLELTDMTKAATCRGELPDGSADPLGHLANVLIGDNHDRSLLLT